MTVADRNYELVPESESEQREAQVNLMKVAEDPNQYSVVPKTSFNQKAKPWSITPTFKLMQLYLYMILCIKYLGVD
jgi:hypothetical protein